MPKVARKPAARRVDPSADAIDDLLNKLRHPERRLIDAVRALIATAAPKATEQVKWNAPSFAMSEHFATLNLRATRGVRVRVEYAARKRGPHA